MKYLGLLWSGIWRRRGRTTLLLLQISVAFLLFGSLQGFKSGMDAALNGIDATVFIVRRASGSGVLPIAQRTRIDALPEVVDVQPQSILIGTYQNPKQIVGVIATDVPVLIRDKKSISISPGALERLASTSDGVLAGRGLVTRYHWSVGDRIPLQTNVARRDGSLTWTFELIGIMDDPDGTTGFNQAMVAKWDSFNEARAEQRDTVLRYVMRVRDRDDGIEVAHRIDAMFANSPDETLTESLDQAAQEAQRSIGDLNFIVRAVVGAVMFALLFSTGTMVMQSTRERAGEIAVLRTIGFSDRRVVGLLLFETIILCAVAASIGLWLASQLLPLTQRTGIAVSMPVEVVVTGWVIALGLALISGCVPAWQVLRIGIATALAERSP